MEGVRMSSMNKCNESDWRLFRSRLPIWQEAYMERRNREYIALLSGGGSASEKFWVWGDRIFEKCGIGRDEGGDGGKTLEIRGKRRLSARDGGANYQQS